MNNKVEEVVNITSKLIKIPTLNPPGNSLKEGAEFIKDYLRQKGFSASILEFDRGWPVVISQSKPRDKNHVMLNGHYDVVPVGDEKRWKNNPFSGLILENLVYGRGATDMKGGLAVLMKVFSDLADKLEYDLVFTAVPDEETGGFHGSMKLAEVFKPDLVLISEPSGSNSICLGEKGLLQVKLVSVGKSAHGSLPSLGENAIMKLIRSLTSLQKISDYNIGTPKEVVELLRAKADMNTEKDYLSISFNPGVIRGGVKVNVVPDYAEAEVDMRIPPGITVNDAIALVEELVEGVKVEPFNISEPNYTSPDNTYVKLLENVIMRRLNVKPIKYIMTGATDGRFFRYKGVPTIIYGPGGLNLAHSYDEYVTFQELEKTYEVISSFLLDISNYQRS